MKRILMLIGLVSLFIGSAALAQTKDISSLTDAEVRQLLIERLDEKKDKPEAAFNPARVAWKFQQSFSTVKTEAGKIFGAYDQLPTLPGQQTRGRWLCAICGRVSHVHFGRVDRLDDLAPTA